MDLKFTGRQIWFLNAVIRQPLQYLPFGESGLVNQQNGAPVPYRAGPKDRPKVITLKNWIESLMEKDKQKDQFIMPKDEAIIETQLTKSYVTFLKDMITYYERVGSLVQWCEIYEQTLLALDGKDKDYGIDSLAEAMGPKGVDKDKDKDKAATA